ARALLRAGSAGRTVMSIPVVTPDTEDPAVRCPESFRYWQARADPRVQAVERLIRAVTGSDLFPADEQAKALCADMFAGDPVAERFVAEVMRAGEGRENGRRLLETALRDGIDSIADPPPSMRALFDEFETVPA